MHNLFFTDNVDKQIHITKPGTSSLEMTDRCTIKAMVHRAAFRATLTSWKCPKKPAIIALNRGMLSCQDNIKHWCCCDHLDTFQISKLSKTFHFLSNTESLPSGTATWTLVVSSWNHCRKVIWALSIILHTRDICMSLLYIWTYSRTFSMETYNFLKCYFHWFTKKV